MARAGGAAWRPFAALAIAGLAVVTPGRAMTDTLEWSLLQAYQNNPSLNAQRAALRAQDEAVPQALSGYRPRVALTASVGNQFSNTLTKSVTPAGPVYTGSSADMTPHSVGLTATQTLFNGFQTANRTRQTESQVSAGRATLAVTEQTAARPDR